MTQREGGQTDPTPVVLVHGWGGTYADTWVGSAIEERLSSRGRDVIRLDLPGHGSRSVSHSAEDYATIGEQLDAALPRAKQLDAVGFSLGGKLLLYIAACRPGRFRRLAIGGVGANLFRPEAGNAVAEALLGEIPPNAPQALRSVVERARRSTNDPLGLAAVIRRKSRLLTPEAIATITADTLLVVGSADEIAGPLEPLARAMSGARSMVVDGLDHLSTPSSPEFQTPAADFILGCHQQSDPQPF